MTPKEIFAASDLLDKLRTLRSQKRALTTAECWDDIAPLIGKLASPQLFEKIREVVFWHVVEEIAGKEAACRGRQIEPDAEWPGFGDP